MKIIPFTPEEIELAIEVNKKGISWKPKSGDWFIDLSSLRVTYIGEYVQSVSICLVLDEDGRSVAYYELIIDGEENGNRMKKSLSFKDKDTFGMFNWVPDLKDCINLIDKRENYCFLNLEKKDDIFLINVLDKDKNQIICQSGNTERIAFYKLFLSL